VVASPGTDEAGLSSLSVATVVNLADGVKRVAHHAHCVRGHLDQAQRPKLIKANVGASVSRDVGASGALPLTEGKARHVVDHR
jgi:hypothetical protein